jgi:hypothetical protein
MNIYLFISGLCWYCWFHFRTSSFSWIEVRALRSSLSCHIRICSTIDPKSLAPFMEKVTTVSVPSIDRYDVESNVSTRRFDWIGTRWSDWIVEGEFSKKVFSINVFNIIEIVDGNDSRLRFLLKVNVRKILFAKKEKF